MKNSLGEQEMELLRYIADQPPMTVRDVASHFEKEKGLARTTVLTVMERLRKKGYLKRAKNKGIFEYSPKFNTGDIIGRKVSEFIERTLNGSVSPLFSHFLKNKNLSEQEIQILKNLAAKLDQKLGDSDDQ